MEEKGPEGLFRHVRHEVAEAELKLGEELIRDALRVLDPEERRVERNVPATITVRVSR